MKQDNVYINKYYYNSKSKEIIKNEIKSKTIGLDILREKNLLGIELVNNREIKKRIFFGKILSYDRKKTSDFLINLELDYLKRNNIEKAIFCDCGYIVKEIKENDITIDEIILKYLDNHSKEIYINLDEFITKLGEYFLKRNYEVTETVSERFIDFDLSDEDLVVIRNYKIYLDNYLEYNVDGIISENNLGKNNTSFIKLNILEESLTGLLKEHFDLIEFLNDYKINNIKNDLNNIKEVQIKRLYKY